MSTPDLETWPFLIFGRQTELGEALNALLRTQGMLSEIHYVEDAKALAEENPADWSLLLWDPEVAVAWTDLPADLRGHWESVPRITMFAQTPKHPPEETWICLDAPELTRRTLMREHQLARLARERSRLLFEMEEANRNVRLVLETLETPVAFLQDGLYLYANPAYLASFGLDSYEGGSFLEAFSARDRNRVKQTLKAVLQSAEQKIETLEATPAQQEQVARLSLRAATFAGEPATLVMRHLDIPKAPAPPLRTEPAPVASAPEAPAPSGILEAADFLVRLEEQLQARQPKRSEQAVVIGGIERVTDLMEQYGPFTLEAAWMEIARKVAARLSPTDRATRLGWEFCLWIERPRDGSLEKWVQDLQAAISNQAYDALDQSILINLRFGISERIARSNPRSLVREAQIATQGPQPVNRYQPNLGTGGQPEGIMDALARMIERKTLPLVTRPILSLIGSDSRTRLELALNPNLLTTLHLESWDEFFRLAEDSENLDAMESLLIETARSLLARPGTPKGCVLYLRMRGTALFKPETQAWLGKSLQQKSESKIVFLFQERMVAGQLKKTQEWISRFKPLGAGIGLDGFGESAHSAILLKHVKPDLVSVPATYLVPPEDAEEAAADPSTGEPPQSTRILAPLKANAIEILATGVDQARLMTSLLNLGVSLVEGPFVGEDAKLG